MINKAKADLEEGKQLIGTFFELGSEEAIEAIGVSGMDFLIIDNEHGPFDTESTMKYIRACELRDTTPLVRVKGVSRDAVLKSLDVGARGLVVPCVETVDQVKSLVEWAKYFPMGNRGFFMARTSGYGHDEVATGTIENYMNHMNENTWLFPQCETMGALNNIEEICAIEGVDGIFIGPFDLSAAMGIPTQFTKKEFEDAIERVLKACKDNGKISLIYAPSMSYVKKFKEMGFDCVAFSMDTDFLIRALKKAKSAFDEI